MAEIFRKNREKPIFLTLDHMGTPPLKMKISKIGLRHVLSWPKLGLEPKFHESGTFGGFGKRGQTNRQTRFMFYKYRFTLFILLVITFIITFLLEFHDTR